MDLRPYGVNLTMTKAKPKLRVDMFHVAKSSGFISRNDLVITMNGVDYRVLQILGEGSFGKAFKVVSPTGEEYAIKMISGVFLFFGSTSRLNEVLDEAVLQIMVVEASKGQPHGPYAPILHEIAFDNSKAQMFIRSELMYNTLDHAISAFNKDGNDVLIPDALIQISDILDFLGKEIQFNHRDMKANNIMYNKEGVRRIYKLIDFGFACATYKGITVTGGDFFKRRPCFKNERDISQLMWTIHEFSKSHMSAKLISAFQLILQASVKGVHACDMIKKCPAQKLREFKNIYTFLNRSNVEVPAGDPVTVKSVMKLFLEKKPLAIAPPAAPVLPHVAPIPPAPMEELARCPPGKIRNPKTRKCVNATGKLGREIMKALAAIVAAPAPAPAPAPPCPPGKIRNPKTRKCVKADGKIGRALAPAAAAVPICPPGKILNPETGRCVNATGAIGRKLLKP